MYYFPHSGDFTFVFDCDDGLMVDWYKSRNNTVLYTRQLATNNSPIPSIYHYKRAVSQVYSVGVMFSITRLDNVKHKKNNTA